MNNIIMVHTGVKTHNMYIIYCAYFKIIFSKQEKKNWYIDMKWSFNAKPNQISAFNYRVSTVIFIWQRIGQEERKEIFENGLKLLQGVIISEEKSAFPGYEV